MRALRCLLFLVSFSLVSVSLSAQQTTSTSSSTAASDPQAIALLQQSLAALIGGLPVTDVTLTGTAHRIAGSDDETGTATLKANSTADSRVDLSFPSGQRSEIRNHAALPLAGSLPPGAPATVAQSSQPVGEWLGPDGAPHGVASHNTITDAAWFFPALMLQRLAASPNSVLSFFGQENHNGQSVLRVSAFQQIVIPSASEGSASSAPPGPSLVQMMQHLSQMDLYLDSSSLLPVAVAFNTHPDNNALLDIPVEIRFSGYQTISGTRVPLHVQRFLNNGLVLDLQFTNATLNSGLSASAFALQ